MNKEANIDKQHYFDRKYLKKERMYSFVEQIEIVKKFVDEKDSILEIGKGNGFVSAFLHDYLGYETVKTVDINDDLKPDYVDDIIAPRQLKENSFDVITCYEVLEHMPFEKSILAVQNMVKIARKYVLISVPDMRYFISLRGTIFGTLPIMLGKLFSTRRFRNPNKKFGDDHFWEVGLETDKVKFSAEHVRDNLFKNMNVVVDQRDIAVPWHHYYVIKINE
ncbi:MAG: methyltransferase domain-containing protein [Calditrichaeota bacterium]|nr:MAG: methyltransferase domain-containing protein [Calditrichota bacterium]MBL1206321.1 methyltransferase domain-containing protein [Calditrichota bacterium]NOG46147.1 methyltransferase domain-containing protein [Calditrichota bacterium]